LSLFDSPAANKIAETIIKILIKIFFSLFTIGFRN